MSSKTVGRLFVGLCGAFWGALLGRAFGDGLAGVTVMTGILAAMVALLIMFVRAQKREREAGR